MEGMCRKEHSDEHLVESLISMLGIVMNDHRDALKKIVATTDRNTIWQTLKSSLDDCMFCRMENPKNPGHPLSLLLTFLRNIKKSMYVHSDSNSGDDVDSCCGHPCCWCQT